MKERLLASRYQHRTAFMKIHILVIDDEFTIRQTIKLILGEKYEILEAENGSQAFHILETVKIDLVLLDINLDGMSGIEILSKIRLFDPEILIIMVTVEREISKVVECMKLGATDYITKPFNETELETAIKRVQTELELKSTYNYLSWEANEQSKRFNLVGKSKAMMDLYNKLDQISKIDTSVLIIGETGTGKEMVARALHRLGPRSKKPFIPVNCAAIPVNLIESELFGYEHGAFTGAKERKKGIFELANGGTIFLDEISELSLEAQAKLLRVLQTGDFSRLGGTQIIYSDVVVYATINQDLEQLVHSGKFRIDLYYRLNVVELKVPSLNERQEDIPLLIKHFIEKYCDGLKFLPKPIDPIAVYYLQNKILWKGNVRELEHSVLRALIFSRGSKIELSDFSLPKTPKPSIQELQPFIVQQINSIPLTKQALESLRKALQLELSRLFDQQILERIKTQFQGNFSSAIKDIGIQRTYLYKIMNRIGVTPDQWKN